MFYGVYVKHHREMGLVGGGVGRAMGILGITIERRGEFAGIGLIGWGLRVGVVCAMGITRIAIEKREV